MERKPLRFLRSLLTNTERKWLIKSNHIAARHYRELDNQDKNLDVEMRMAWFLLGIMASKIAFKNTAVDINKKLSKMYIHCGRVFFM